MRLVVADTSPVFYLLSIDHIDLLPQLFGKIFVPDAVRKELCHPAAPVLVREWAVGLPAWVEVISVEPLDDAALLPLGAGEREAITLAISMRADLILIDERQERMWPSTKDLWLLVHLASSLWRQGAA
jgi:predicted nucleic acid-binding protein